MLPVIAVLALKHAQNVRMLAKKWLVEILPASTRHAG